MSGPGDAEHLAQLQAFTALLKPMDERQMRELVIVPERRTQAKAVLASLEPWLTEMEQVANVARRLRRALSDTAGRIRA